MNQIITPAAVRRSVTVQAPPERAWAVFTADIGLWWPKTHSIGTSPIKTATLEPRQGGRWYETGEDGSQCQWGEVLTWEPPSLLVLAWRISGDWRYDPDLLTEVEVKFTPQAGATRVDLEHRHLERMGEAEQRARAAFESPNGWAGLLALFADAV